MAFQIAGEAEIVLEHEYVAKARLACLTQSIQMASQAADRARDHFRVSLFGRNGRGHPTDAIERRLCGRQFPQYRVVPVNSAIRIDDIDLLYRLPENVVF